MSGIKKTIELYFEAFGRMIYKHRLKCIISTFFFMGVLASQLPKLAMDTSSEAMLDKDDPVRIEYNAFRDQFGRDEVIIIAIKSSDIFTEKFLKKLKSFHNDLENTVPYVKEVNSLINARTTYAKGDVLYVEELLGNWPEKQIDFNSLRQRVMNNPLFKNYIISENGELAAIIIETDAKTEDPDDILNSFDEGVSEQKDLPSDGKNSSSRHYLAETETAEVVATVKQVMAQYNSSDFSMTLSGGPVIIDSFNKTTMKDMMVTTSVCMAGIIFFLFILFRRISGIILPLLIIEAGLLSTFGLMALFGAPFTLTTNALVCFLLAVGVADSVHVLTIFYMKFSNGTGKEDAVAYALGHSGLPIVLTSVTTAAGLLSFSMSELTPIADVGIYGAAGVMLALLYTIILLPSLIALIPIKQNIKYHYKSGLMDRMLLFFTDFSTKNPKKILSVCIIIFIISVIALGNLRFSLDTLGCFRDTAATKKDALFIDRQLKGMTALEVVIDTKKENGICDPVLLNSIEKFSNTIEELNTTKIFAGKVFSINDIIKEVNKALNEDDKKFYTIPQNRDLITQELFLFENSGSDDLEKSVDSQLAKTRITIKTPFVDGMIYKMYIEDVEKHLKAILPGNIDFYITGAVALTARAMTKALSGMSKSYLIAFLVISLFMFVFVGDVKLGILCMVPNLLPIMFVMGIMGMADIPLDMTTIMIGCFAMGLVVDDTLHFIYNFQKYYNLTGSTYEAVKETLLGTGRAIVITSLILCAGFLPDLLATLTNVNRFGSFISLTVILALLADLVVAPALMVCFFTKKSEAGGVVF